MPCRHGPVPGRRRAAGTCAACWLDMVSASFVLLKLLCRVVEALAQHSSYFHGLLTLLQVPTSPASQRKAGLPYPHVLLLYCLVSHNRTCCVRSLRSARASSRTPTAQWTRTWCSGGWLATRSATPSGAGKGACRPGRPSPRARLPASRLLPVVRAARAAAAPKLAASPATVRMT